MENLNKEMAIQFLGLASEYLGKIEGVDVESFQFQIGELVQDIVCEIE